MNIKISKASNTLYTKLLKPLILTLLLFTSYSNAALASDPSDKTDVGKFINNTSQKVISIAESNNSSKDKELQLTLLFNEVMDINWIAKFVLGKYWNTLNDQEKASYLEIYHKYLVASYVPLFKKYNGQQLIIKEIKPIDNEQYIVTTEIQSETDNQDYLIEYRLKFINGHFRVRDIIAEGVSLLTTQRSEFGAAMGESGINGLKEKLKEKITSSA